MAKEAKDKEVKEAVVEEVPVEEVAEEVVVAEKAPYEASVKLLEKEVGANPLQLPWPADPYGLNAALRSGGLKAATNVRGDKEKLKKLIATVDVIVKHAKVLYVRDLERAKEAKENSVAARARVADKLKRQAEAKAAEYEKAAKAVRKNAGIDK